MCASSNMWIHIASPVYCCQHGSIERQSFPRQPYETNLTHPCARVFAALLLFLSQATKANGEPAPKRASSSYLFFW